MREYKPVLFCAVLPEEFHIQSRRIKSSQSPERKLRCYRTGLCFFSLLIFFPPAL